MDDLRNNPGQAWLNALSCYPGYDLTEEMVAPIPVQMAVIYWLTVAHRRLRCGYRPYVIYMDLEVTDSVGRCTDYYDSSFGPGSIPDRFVFQFCKELYELDKWYYLKYVVSHEVGHMVDVLMNGCTVKYPKNSKKRWWYHRRSWKNVMTVMGFPGSTRFLSNAPKSYQKAAGVES